MEKKNTFLLILLPVLLAIVTVLALVLQPGTGASGEAPVYGIVINEISTKNETIIADNTGKYRDYVELYNGGEDVDLTGFTLTDGKVRCQPFTNVVLASGEYRVVFLGDAVTGFGLGAAGGDCIQLLDANGHIVCQANTAACREDEVMLYSGGIYQISTEASPGFSNDAAGIAAFREGSPCEAPKLIISEVLLGNNSVLPDENGIFSDIVELYNCSDEAISLGRYFLSDDAAQRFAYRLPDVMLGSGEYAVIYCDGESHVAPSGQIHANFGLLHGEILTLTDHHGQYLQLTAAHCGDDTALAMVDAGTYEAASPTPGFANTEEGLAQFLQSRVNSDSPLVINEVLLSSAGVPYGGSFTDVVEILNTSDQAVSTAGWYLSDGSDPYRYPLEEVTLQPGQYLVIPCSPQSTGFSLGENETVYLMGPDFRYAQPVSCVAGQTGQSICLIDDSYTHGPVTLGYENLASNQDLFLSDQLPDGLRISEVMSANQSYLAGPYGATSDWIELYNPSSETIDLSEYCLTDSAGNLSKYPLPEMTLETGDYCVIFLSDKDTRLRSGYKVLPFSLSSEGETLYLSKNNQICDYVLLPELSPNDSYGRGSGDAFFSVLEKVTAGKANSAAAQITAMPVAVTPQGSYDDVKYVEVSFTGEGNIYYTTNCTTPSTSSKLYTGPIRITKTTVFRVICKAEGKKSSDVLTVTYLVNENDLLPAVSVVTSPGNLYDFNSGIYVKGPGASDKFPFKGANFWQDWEKPANVSLFETDGSACFSINCGIKIHGAFTRGLLKKSLACICRDTYGDAWVNYPIFGEEGLDKYGAFILRSAGQDAFMGRMRDVVITSLMSDYTDMQVQKYKPVVVYLNGRYYGLHYIREKINEYYVAGNFNVNAEDVTIVEWSGHGDQGYQKLINYAMEHDLSKQEHYDYIASQVDIENYTDYIIAQIIIGNTDNGNVKYTKLPGGKWTWLMFDTDLSMRDSDFNSVADHLNPQTIGKWDHTSKTLAVRLLKNPDYRDYFLKRMAWQMNTIWTTENILARVEEIETIIETDMIKDCDRWNNSYERWRQYVNEIRSFAKKRGKYLPGYIKDYFDLSASEMKAYGFTT